MKWPSVAIGEISEKVASWNPAESGDESEICYIDIGAVDRETKRITLPQKVVAKDAPSRARQLVKKSDILVSTVRPNLNAVACVPNELDGATASTGFCVLRLNQKIADPNYLFHYVKTGQFVSYLIAHATGASYPAVSDEIIRRAKIPLPPLEEQRRIAAMLDKADAIRQKRQAAQQLADDFLKAAFLDMFGDPITNPKSWEVVRLEQAANQVVDCPHSTPTWTDTGIVCLRTSNLAKGDWDWSDTRYVDDAQYRERTQRSEIVAGDIILSREGTVGIAAIVHDGMKVCMGQRLVQVRPDPRKTTSQYLLSALLWLTAPEHIGRVMVGSTSQHLNVGELRRIKIPLPPLPLQKRFLALSAAQAKLRASQARHAELAATQAAALAAGVFG